MTKPNKEDEDVYEFRVEDNPDHSYAGVIKYRFLQQNSSGPVAQIKEVPTVILDDDDDDGHYSTDDNSVGPLESPHKAGLEVLDDDDDDGHYSTDDNSDGPIDSPHKAGLEVVEDFNPMPDKVLKQHWGFTESIGDQKIVPLCAQMRASTPLPPPPKKGHESSMIPESPCHDVSVDSEDLDDNVSAHESFPSTPDSELGENNDQAAGQVHGQSVGDSKMDMTDTIAIHTDYVAYGEKYYPASLIIISRDSVKLKASALEEESVACFSEWKVDDILKIETQWSSAFDVAKVRFRFLTRGVTHAEIANGMSAVEVVEFLVPNWSEQQERMLSLNRRYNAAMSMGPNMDNYGDDVLSEENESSSDPYIPNFKEPFEEVVYPKGEIDAVSVGKNDVDLLQPELFINDTIIDFYITYLKNGITSERRHSFHFFSSFFFRKLADLDKNPSSVSDGKAAFQRVRRWTRKLNIFEKDYIFIPVNYNLHWSLIVLCHLSEITNFNDENINEALKVPCILHMDSIRGSHVGLKDLIRSYLLEEWKERQKDTSEDITSKFLNLRFLSLELPQQENLSDCGLFLLHYAELFIEQAPVNFSPFQINKYDRFLTRDWFVPAEGSLKRVHIQRLIYELLKSRSHECVAPSRNNLSHSPALPVNKGDDNGIEIVSEKRHPETSCKESSLYSESGQDMDIGLHDMPLYRRSDNVDNSGLCMTELLEHCQNYNRGTPLANLGFSITPITEVEDDEHLAHTNSGQTGFLPIDRVGYSHIDSSGNFDQKYQWNLESSDEEYSVDTSYSDSHSRGDSDDDSSTRESDEGIQNPDSYQNENIDQLNKVADSEEGYASASSDMMETPPEDSQELAEKFGIHDQEGPLFPNVDEMVEEPMKDSGFNEDKIVESSPPDQPRPAKRLRLTPSRSEARPKL